MEKQKIPFSKMETVTQDGIEYTTLNKRKYRVYRIRPVHCACNAIISLYLLPMVSVHDEVAHRKHGYRNR